MTLIVCIQDSNDHLGGANEILMTKLFLKVIINLKFSLCFFFDQDQDYWSAFYDYYFFILIDIDEWLQILDEVKRYQLVRLILYA